MMSPGFVGCDTDLDATFATWNVWNSSGTTTCNTNANIWIPWNKVCTTTSAANSEAAGVLWYDWNACRVPVTTASYDGTWHTWTVNVGKPFNGVVRATPEDLARIERQAEEVRARESERQRQWEAERPERERREREASRQRTIAAQRAERLLLELLDAEQAEKYRQDKKFYVVGADGERYLVDAARTHGNIYKMNAKGEMAEKLCVPLGDDCPAGDHIVAQLLALRHNINHLLAKANRTQLLGNGAERILPRRA